MFRCDLHLSRDWSQTHHFMEVMAIITTTISVVLVFVATGTLFVANGTATNSSQDEFREMQEFLNFLSALQYDTRIRPGLDTGNPTLVNVSMHFNFIADLSDVSMDFTINIFLRQNWNDPRLAFAGNTSGLDSVTLGDSTRNDIWVPDLYFMNEKNSRFHTVTTPNRMIIISANGDIMYSQRLTETLSCAFNLANFPMDKQACRINIESYAYNINNLVLSWKETDPLSFAKDAGRNLADFTLMGTTTGDCSTIYPSGGYTCIYAEMSFRRDLNYYLIQVYAPSVVVVLLSFVNFWIDPTAVPARTTIGIITILTISTQSVSVQSGLPRVSYVKAIDVWNSVCLVFVMASMLEYAVVNFLLRRKKAEDVKELTKPDEASELPGHSSTPSESSWVGVKTSPLIHCAKRTPAEMVDYTSRYLFISAFFLFNTVYWSVYLPSY
ncbi:glycine receptor subunit alpha-2 [Lingula anatina]|uniref:Gamma-aminobutyric acid receptor subunit beta n=1 Tax=Lingula anatina TaxID=7574 RepID=A0A1S3JVQ6_LINAN|nr:glycine receptor subunit alpha-2 [Lingula anatina]|eukprot:XP_013414141.1 glycine receptor subunit alpha-2 [Lingula anatina]